MGEIWGVKWEIFGKILRDFWVKFCVIFENIQWFTSGIDASEIWRSLSIESLNVPGYTYKLVKVHLTNLYIGIGSK